MAFQYTFRADDISTWDADTRDLVENRDRELELYASTIDNSFLNLNADNLASGTVPSSRVTGSYTGITQVGTLTAGVASYSIGDTGPAGGKVFITPSTSGNTTGLYFEAAPVSTQVQRTWAQFAPINYTTTNVVGTLQAIGQGKFNTTFIVNQGNNDPATCAAKYCDDLTYNGFSDWFLPSLNELYEMYYNRVSVGGLSGRYWGSFQTAAIYGSNLDFDNIGGIGYLVKTATSNVRAVRSFSTTALSVNGTVNATAFSGLGASLTSLNASSLSSGTVASARISGSYTGITNLADLTMNSLTISGAGANRSITINAPTGYYALQYFQIGGVFKWHNEVNPAGDRWSLVQTGVAERIGVTSTGATFSGTVTATTFSGSGTGITQLGTISPSLTVTGGTGTTITATTQTLINGTNNNGAIYLGGNTASSSTGGIEASWRDAANPSIAIGVTRDNNRTMTVHSYADNTIRFYAANTVKAYVNGGGFLATHYYGNVQYGSYGSLSVYGENAGWYGIVFPDQATTWMSAANGQYFGCYRNNTTWNFYVNNGTFVPSDERYKRDIQPLENGLNFIREIIPVTYDPLTESLDDAPETTVGKTHYGFTTQNILQALLNSGETRNVAVVDIGGPATQETNSDRQYLNHSALLAPMVKAIQELDLRLQQLETV